MSIFDENVKQVNGPINVIRMEGEVNGIKKIIYLFMDLHIDLSEESECKNLFSKDIDKYLVENFKKLNDSDKIYDFFLEIDPERMQNISYGYNYPINLRDNYIGQVIKMFQKIFVYEPDENKVYVSDYFRNIRLHYIDVRSYYQLMMSDIINSMNTMVISMWKNIDINLNILDLLSDRLVMSIDHFQTIIDIINTYQKGKSLDVAKFSVIKYTNSRKQTPNQSQPEPSHTEKLYYLLKKTFEKYKHKNIRDKLEKMLETIKNDLTDSIKEFDSMLGIVNTIKTTIVDTTNRLIYTINETYEYGPDPTFIRNMLLYLINSMSKLKYHHVTTFINFMDAYFLRRFLDKDYITNAITYTGASHTTTYVMVLAKDFGFKITHVAYASINNIDELNSVILKSDVIDLKKIFFPPNLSQCSDISHFPKMFS